ncbi:MAG: hypothetical protein RR140_01385, partial [Clostridia bacterium]
MTLAQFFNNLGLSKQQVEYVLQSHYNSFNANVETLQKKVEFYKKTFNLTNEEFNKIFVSLPALLNRAESTV